MTNENEILAELLDAALGALEEGMAVLDEESHVVAWNPAATAITGYQSAERLARGLPVGFYEIDAHSQAMPGSGSNGLENLNQGVGEMGGMERPVLVKLRHSQGHVLPVMLRRSPLRDALGRRFGMLMRFHPVEEIDTLPHGALDEDGGLDPHVEHSLSNMEGRLDEAWQEWIASRAPFGLLWIMVDQAATLRRTHGRDASEAMLAIVERTLLHALRPTEIMGRWGTNEFLVLCHERTAEMLLLHGRRIGELARSADFRWWGDRVSLTVSVGAAQAEAGGKPGGKPDDKLGEVLERARHAMLASRRAGGNEIVLREMGETLADSGGHTCSQS
jgi:diguanylate cyclase (GGDEF)-like protein/PAS domain S-box-containing protein